MAEGLRRPRIQFRNRLMGIRILEILMPKWLNHPYNMATTGALCAAKNLIQL
jgi:hypothetical protein